MFHVEHRPDVAARVFGPRLAEASAYVDFLAGAGLERGLMGPRERDRLWTRHVLNCAVLAELVPSGARVVDIGSGAGLPGIPLALAAPAVRVDLVESLLRRATFLSEAVDLCGLAEQCRVVRGRAEEVRKQVGGADIVTARAVAPLGKLARWAAPLLRTGGMLLAMKGESAAEEIERDSAELRAVGLGDVEIVEVGVGVLDVPTTVVRAVLRKARK